MWEREIKLLFLLSSNQSVEITAPCKDKKSFHVQALAIPYSTGNQFVVEPGAKDCDASPIVAGPGDTSQKPFFHNDQVSHLMKI